VNLEYRAATLAIGTELTDGQVVDRNSAWLSRKMVASGLEVLEHRTVPDDRREIAIALGEISRKVSHLFVTGGLGPTSDDFTREVIADYFGRALQFDENSWQRIVARFRERGVEARPIQRQQCYFPRDAEILENPAGTANAFRFKVVRHGQPSLNVYVMPGPPAEIAAVWDLHYKTAIDQIVPISQRSELYILRTLGRGESEIAEIVEKEIEGKGIRVGYRAHLPYIEVKLWFKQTQRPLMKPITDTLEKKLSASLVSLGDEDLADGLVQALRAGESISIDDSATMGIFQARVAERLGADSGKGSISILTRWPAKAEDGLDSKQTLVSLTEEGAGDTGQWHLRVKNAHGKSWDLAVQPTSIYKFGSERGRRYFTEKAFHLLKTEILPNLRATK
jgi:nicotinamide-nucleotide amidase